jgi:hypothetical protein
MKRSMCGSLAHGRSSQTAPEHVGRRIAGWFRGAADGRRPVGGGRRAVRRRSLSCPARPESNGSRRAAYRLAIVAR